MQMHGGMLPLGRSGKGLHAASGVPLSHMYEARLIRAQAAAKAGMQQLKIPHLPSNTSSLPCPAPNYQLPPTTCRGMHRTYQAKGHVQGYRKDSRQGQLG